ncbi:MAG: helix-turn-helix domain-containing protein [Hyphomicrobium sp.]|nr:helix-turn-helix domain-containing protein [Hyphomicrobium sp.]ODT21651.1 MAG: MerR family transcriptional regulator [Hyphomicrobium sp. SCN 65-11]
MTAISIGELARQTGVKVPTIRYYESIGLLPDAPRSQSNRRQYGTAAVERLQFIRHARELGFEVQAIRELLSLAREPRRSCAQVDALARNHLQAVTRRIERLTALKSELEQMIKACARGRIADCRILDTLSQDHTRSRA